MNTATGAAASRRSSRSTPKRWAQERGLHATRASDLASRKLERKAIEARYRARLDAPYGEPAAKGGRAAARREAALAPARGRYPTWRSQRGRSQGAVPLRPVRKRGALRSHQREDASA